MAATEKRSFTLSTEQGALIDRLVQSGRYATASEVIRDGLRALQAREAAVERWLREEVAATYDDIKAHPDRVLSSAGMAERARKRHEARMKRDA